MKKKGHEMNEKLQELKEWYSLCNESFFFLDLNRHQGFAFIVVTTLCLGFPNVNTMFLSLVPKPV